MTDTINAKSENAHKFKKTNYEKSMMKEYKTLHNKELVINGYPVHGKTINTWAQNKHLNEKIVK